MYLHCVIISVIFVAPFLFHFPYEFILIIFTTFSNRVECRLPWSQDSNYDFNPEKIDL
jgi:hypothetical protein